MEAHVRRHAEPLLSMGIAIVGAGLRDFRQPEWLAKDGPKKTRLCLQRNAWGTAPAGRNGCMALSQSAGATYGD